MADNISQADASAARLRATAAGFAAVLLWSTLAALAIAAGKIPPFQLVAMCFVVAALIGAAMLAANRAARDSLRRIAPGALMLGVAGLFGYHFFYFLALQTAPAVEANLVNYLWPLFIVMLSGLAPGSTPLRARHVAGALVAFAGAAAVMAARSGGEWDSGALWGFASALVAAVLWAGYSVLSRYFRETPSAAVALYCGATAAGSALAQIALVGPFEPLATQQWLAVAALGLGPVGLAFYLWDYGCKHGDIRLLGVSAYTAPLLSTLLLAALGLGEAGPVVWLAAAAIAGGALIAAR